MLTEATKANLRRKSGYIDKVQMHDGAPLFSWCDLSLTELCNRSHGHPRACTFCPRIDPAFYPNQALHMPLGLARKIAGELQELDYQGAVVLCGFGEPLLHPHISELCGYFGHGIRLEIVTNGDRLNARTISDLIERGVDYFVVSLYDGPQQIDTINAKFREAGIDDSYYILRDRWHTAEDDFGLKLTNRAGTVSVGHQDAVDVTHPCHYLAYQLTIDWNGDALLCVQDWHKKVKYGNVNQQSLLEIWRSTALHKRRMQLINGKRTASPCSSCNADGTLHGDNHAEAWQAA